MPMVNFTPNPNAPKSPFTPRVQGPRLPTAPSPQPINYTPNPSAPKSPFTPNPSAPQSPFTLTTPTNQPVSSGGSGGRRSGGGNSSRSTDAPSLSVKTEVIGSSVDGGYIVQQTNPFTGERRTSYAVPTQASYSGDAQEFELKSNRGPFGTDISMQYNIGVASIQNRGPFVGTNDNVLRVSDQGIYNIQTRRGQVEAGLGAIRANTLEERRLQKEFFERKTQTNILLGNTGRVSASIGSPSIGFVQDFARQSAPSISSAGQTLARSFGQGIVNIRTGLNLGDSRAFLEDPLAQQAAQRAQTQFVQERGFFESLPVIGGFGLRIGRRDSATAYVETPKGRQAITPFQIVFTSELSEARLRAKQRFESEYISGGGNPEQASRFATEYLKQSFGREAGTEAALLGVGAGAEVIGRSAVAGLTVGRRFTLAQSTRRIALGTGAAGAFEGGAQSYIEQSQTGRVSIGRTAFDAVLGSASAGTISATQFRLDVGRRSRQRGYDRTFNALVNIGDLQEPVSDALATGSQRTARTFGVRSFTSEPTVQFNTRAQTPSSFLFGSSPVMTQTQSRRVAITSRITPSARQSTSTFLGVPTSARTSTRTNINPFTSTRTTTFTQTPVSTVVGVPTSTRSSVRSPVSVLTPNLPPLFPPLFRSGRSRSRGGGILGSGTSQAFTSSLSGRVFGFGGRSGSLQALTGIGARR